MNVELQTLEMTFKVKVLNTPLKRIPWNLLNLVDWIQTQSITWSKVLHQFYIIKLSFHGNHQYRTASIVLYTAFCTNILEYRRQDDGICSY